jgi:citronellol/citronellal dehydrogenase
MTRKLEGRTIFITGASRGIGREIALKAAADGANIVIAAKSSEPHKKLPGTIHTVAREVEAAGGQALALQVDVRDDTAVTAAIAAAVERFGGLDVVINNAGAISLTPAAATPMKRFDLMLAINPRAVMATATAAIPYLRKSPHAHILTLSPPLNLDAKWLKPFIPYTMTKYAMTLLSLGLAEELRSSGVAVNTLWPRTTIATAAVEFEISAAMMALSRTPAIMADAAYEILTTTPRELTGRTLIDEDFLRERGVNDFERYKVDPACEKLAADLYVD